MRLVGNMIFQHLHQSGLANAWITREYDHVPVSSFDLLPTLYEQPYFLLPTDQRCQSSWLRNI